MTLSEAKAYLAEGTHFARGQHGPEDRGGGRASWSAAAGTAIITDPDNVERALAGETGTTIVRD